MGIIKGEGNQAVLIVIASQALAKYGGNANALVVQTFPTRRISCPNNFR